MKNQEQPLVVLAAYLYVCPNCGEHAVIVTGFEEYSQGFDSKREGLEIVAEMLAKGELLPEEAKFLRSEIYDSKLDRRRPERDASSLVIPATEAEEETTKLRRSWVQ